MFIQQKYSRGVHPCQVELNPFSSATWRRILNVSRQVELSMLWLIQDGSCNFWFDNWLGSGALFLHGPISANLSFHNFITQGHWNVQSLSQTLPQNIIPAILDKPVPIEHQSDEVVWIAATSGQFSLASAFHEVHQVRNNSLMFATV